MYLTVTPTSLAVVRRRSLSIAAVFPPVLSETLSFRLYSALLLFNLETQTKPRGKEPLLLLTAAKPIGRRKQYLVCFSFLYLSVSLGWLKKQAAAISCVTAAMTPTRPA